jgi:hypothetical protein
VLAGLYKVRISRKKVIPVDWTWYLPVKLPVINPIFHSQIRHPGYRLNHGNRLNPYPGTVEERDDGNRFQATMSTLPSRNP